MSIRISSLFLFGLASIGLGCTSVTTRDQIQNTETVSAETVELLFSADLATGTGCATVQDAGCDIYRATVNLATGAAADVMRITSDTSGNGFPVWHPTGSTIYFNEYPPHAAPTNIGYANLLTDVVGTLLPFAAHPSILPNGQDFIYTKRPDYTLMRAVFFDGFMAAADSLTLGAADDRFEPSISPDGKYVVYHEKVNDTAQAKILIIATGEILEFSAADGTGHCVFNADGTIAVCDQKRGGGMVARSIADGVLGEPYVIIEDPAAKDIAKIDADFASCASLSANYPAFVDDDTVFVSLSCALKAGDNQSFSKLFLVQLGGVKPTYIPVGANIAAAFGGPGEDSWSPAVRH